MSKIYQALRQHEQEQKPSLSAPATREASHLDGLPTSKRDMQALYHSVETALTGTEDGAIIMLSSAQPGEGKTTVCAGYAVTAASDYGRSVLILDGDRHHPLAGRFGAREGMTVAALVQSPEAVLQGAQRVGTRGSIAVVPVTSFIRTANADAQEIELLAAARDQLKRIWDYILIDAPSIAEVPWTASVGRIADGIILVVEAERTRYPVVMNAKQEFANNGAKLLGVFLNKRRFYIPRRVYRFL